MKGKMFVFFIAAIGCIIVSLIEKKRQNIPLTCVSGGLLLAVNTMAKKLKATIICNGILGFVGVFAMGKLCNKLWKR